MTMEVSTSLPTAHIVAPKTLFFIQQTQVTPVFLLNPALFCNLCWVVAAVPNLPPVLLSDSCFRCAFSSFFLSFSAHIGRIFYLFPSTILNLLWTHGDSYHPGTVAIRQINHSNEVGCFSHLQSYVPSLNTNFHSILLLGWRHAVEACSKVCLNWRVHIIAFLFALINKLSNFFAVFFFFFFCYKTVQLLINKLSNFFFFLFALINKLSKFYRL